MKKLIGTILVSCIVLFGCGKSSEERGDEYMKQGDERNAYLYYQKAVSNSKNGISPQLKEKYLSITVKRARQRLADDESLESIPLFDDEFTKYADSTVSTGVLGAYAQFAGEWADSLYARTKNVTKVISILERAKQYGGDVRMIDAQIEAYKIKFATTALDRAQEVLQQTKSNDDPMLMLETEYWALCAQKYLPGNPQALEILKKTRQANLGTYAAYNRALEEGTTDPEIDRYTIYVAITGAKTRGNMFVVDGTMYNLSHNPLDINKKSFTLFDKDGVGYPPHETSTFDKMTLDVKQETKFSLKFAGKNIAPQRLTMKQGDQETVKWWP